MDLESIRPEHYYKRIARGYYNPYGIDDHRLFTSSRFGGQQRYGTWQTVQGEKIGILCCDPVRSLDIVQAVPDYIYSLDLGQLKTTIWMVWSWRVEIRIDYSYWISYNKWVLVFHVSVVVLVRIRIRAQHKLIINLYRWGQPFVQNTYLYHLTRLDHRHNFSPYFYPIYLTIFGTSDTIASSIVLTSLRHPLASFLPQCSFVFVAGFALTPWTNLPMSVFVQTAAFVIFNKVCTSQVSDPIIREAY